MLNERIRKRLETLNRGPLPLSGFQETKQQTTRVEPQAKAVKPIPGLVRRGKLVTNEAGQHLVIHIPLDEIWPGGEKRVLKRHEHLRSHPVENEQDLAKYEVELIKLLAAFPHDVLLLDLETCGLAGSALFLVGVLRCIEERLTVELLLARDYAEERAVLTSFWEIARRHHTLVTFNGKSFDWPMIQDRSARHLLFRNRPSHVMQHVDLLHHSRRRWREELPDCKLQTLERHICGRGRSDDIPGGQIPAAYQHFVRTGHEREMDTILLHNAIDLVTLLDLAMRLAGPKGKVTEPKL